VHSLRFIAAAVVLSVISPMMTSLFSQGSLLPGLDGYESIPSLTTSSREQETDGQQAEVIWSWSAGTDFVTSYIWRGTRQGRGPHLQPFAECSAGPLTGGVWSTFDFNGYREVDLYIAVEIPGGFLVGLQDYWMADQPISDITAESGSHALEATVGYESEHVSLNANYVLNEAGGAGSYGCDFYIESRFSFDYFSVFLGAGNGWHSNDGSFKACNVGIETGWEIDVNDSFSIPVTAQMCYNPDTGSMFFTAGFSISAGR